MIRLNWSPSFFSDSKPEGVWKVKGSVVMWEVHARTHMVRAIGVGYSYEWTYHHSHSENSINWFTVALTMVEKVGP